MKITAITGSGISAGSGISTYREDPNWDVYAQGAAHYTEYGNHLPELWKHWSAMARTIETAKPNPAHIALAEVGAGIITQNVDGLHTRAGSKDVVELHGEMSTMRCLRCRKTSPCDTSTESPVCGHCGSARVRTNAVLFGEPILKRHVVAAQRLITEADIVVVVGTSGKVFPAREFVNLALEHRSDRSRSTVLFDLEPWPDKPNFTEVILGPAELTLPEYLSSL